jgi:hypothetical protein
MHVRQNKMGGNVTQMGEKRNACRIDIGGKARRKETARKTKT